MFTTVFIQQHLNWDKAFAHFKQLVSSGLLKIKIAKWTFGFVYVPPFETDVLR